MINRINLMHADSLRIPCHRLVKLVSICYQKKVSVIKKWCNLFLKLISASLKYSIDCGAIAHITHPMHSSFTLWWLQSQEISILSKIWVKIMYSLFLVLQHSYKNNKSFNICRVQSKLVKRLQAYFNFDIFLPLNRTSLKI